MFAITKFSCVEVLFHTFILLLLGRRISFVMPRTSLQRGSTVFFKLKRVINHRNWDILWGEMIGF